MSKPLISFHVNSFNRKLLLQNLLHSFDLCNVYPHVEWIITDYGSQDGSREFIRNAAENSPYPIKYIFSDEEKYFAAIERKGIHIGSRWARFRAILGHYRNEARRAATGQFFFDVADDHQFIRQGNWIEELLEIFEFRSKGVVRNDISGIVPYGYIRWRLDKANNTRESSFVARSVPYFIAKQKNYVDYSFMSRATYERVGEFFEPLQLTTGSKGSQMWSEENNYMQPEAEYERRCTQLGLKRAFLKYPITIAFPNDMQTPRDPKKLLAPLWSLDEMVKRFEHLDRPVSSDELLPTPLHRFLETPRLWLNKMYAKN